MTSSVVGDELGEGCLVYAKSHHSQISFPRTSLFAGFCLHWENDSDTWSFSWCGDSFLCKRNRAGSRTLDHLLVPRSASLLLSLLTCSESTAFTFSVYCVGRGGLGPSCLVSLNALSSPQGGQNGLWLICCFGNLRKVDTASAEHQWRLHVSLELAPGLC